MGAKQSHRILSKDSQPDLFKQPRFIQAIQKEWNLIQKNDLMDFSTFKSYFLPYAPDGLASTLFTVYAKHNKSKQWTFEDFLEFSYLIDTKEERIASLLFETFLPTEIKGTRVVKSIDIRRCAMFWFEEQMPESIFGMEGKEIDVR